MPLATIREHEGKRRIFLDDTRYADKDRIAMVPGKRWNGAYWHVPLSWATCVTLRGIFGAELQVAEDLRQWATDERTRRVDPCVAMRMDVDGPGDPRLYPFQRPGAFFMATAEQSLEADEMGAGKTIQTIHAMIELTRKGQQPFPCLVVCPRGVQRQWKREWETWWPGIRVEVCAGGTVKKRQALARDADVYIINWEAVRYHSRLAPYGSVALTDKEKEPKELNKMNLRTVVADEAHKMKEPKSKQTRAVWAVGQSPIVAFRIALTGTPVANDPSDLWSILHFLEPDEWPTKTAFVDRYCLMSWNTYGGLEVIGIRPDRAEEFFQQFDPRFRRMPKELVLPFLPPKARVPRECPMGSDQVKAYRQMEEGMIAQLGEGETLFAPNHLVKRMRLMQFSSSFAELNPDNEVLLKEPSNKLDELEEIMEELGYRKATKNFTAKNGEPMAVFAESRQLIELAGARLVKQGIAFRYIVGGMTDEELERAQMDLLEGRVNVILSTMKTGGLGMNLTRANNVVFLQRSWSMLDNKQAEDRCHRIGSEQHDKILIIDLVAPGTVEEEQIERLHEKFHRLQEIARDKATLAAAGERSTALENEEAAILQGDVV